MTKRQLGKIVKCCSIKILEFSFKFTSFIFLVLISYIFRRTSSASSGLFIVSKNFGDSGKNKNANVFKALTEVMMMMYNLQGAKLMKYKFTDQFIGITKIPMSPEKMNIIGINIETKEAARGAVSFV